ncbi:unnamed protein product [Haemonchus placei]|uniref:I-EGF_1 domain-containing protein n=1 Tax=Haemonchus placei TaxID=6290 RepID=A0A158QJS7_HAEPC|nr:unnamed protein product [Haemonchus placei]
MKSRGLCDDATQLCGSLEAQSSCSQCIKQHPDCAWCRDPHSTEQNRCQVRSAFKPDTCNPSYVYSPTTEIRIGPHVKHLMESSVNNTFHFSRMRRRCSFCDFFKLKVTVMDCRDGSDIAISVGVYGYTTVSALYITPLCGCECEKPNQQNSPLCHQHGNLICGQCVCESTRGGDRCECPLASYGVKNALELEDRCREKPGVPVCSGRGLCRCGQCQCNLQTVKDGRFCQCDHSSCPTGANGRQCSGNGVCECGTCRCEEGWEREDCSCSTDKGTCTEGGVSLTSQLTISHSEVSSKIKILSFWVLIVE